MWSFPCAEDVFRTKPLLDYMRAVPDPRCGRETKHDHAEVLVCLVLGFLAGRTTVRRILRWCRNHLAELREFLPLKNGIASPPTVSRLLAGIDAELSVILRETPLYPGAVFIVKKKEKCYTDRRNAEQSVISIIAYNYRRKL